jgi:hypothetical protein
MTVDRNGALGRRGVLKGLAAGGAVPQLIYASVSRRCHEV